MIARLNADTIMSGPSVHVVHCGDSCVVYEVSRYGFTWHHAHVYVRLMRFAGCFREVSPELYTRDTSHHVRVGTMTFVVCITMHDKMYILDYLQDQERADSMAKEMQEFFHDIKEPNWRQAGRVNRFLFVYRQPDSMVIAAFCLFISNLGVRDMFRYIHPILPSKICSVLSYGPITNNFQAFLEFYYGQARNIIIPDAIEPLRVLTTPEHFADIGVRIQA